jgi:putative component of toxin-antitoxin plasmid stabilization module
MNDVVYERIYKDSLVEEFFRCLKETISFFEGKPREAIHTDRFDEWLNGLRNHVWIGKIAARIASIEERGNYGKGSHKCEAKNDIFELVFREPIRVYFTLLGDDKIQLEDGSSSKSGSGKSGEQLRKIAALDKRISSRSTR